MTAENMLMHKSEVRKFKEKGAGRPSRLPCSMMNWGVMSTIYLTRTY